MLRRRREGLDAYDALKNGCGLRVTGGRGHDAGAVDEVYALGERDVLPDLGLAGDGRDVADLARLEGVDDARLANVRVPDEADGNLLPVRVQLRELAEELDERAFAEGVIRGGVEGEGRVAGGEVLDVACLS